MSRDQMASTSNDSSTFSTLNENAVMNIQKFEEIFSSHKYFDRHNVRAAELLPRDCSTEVVNVNKLPRKCKSIIQYVKIGAARGHLYCINGLKSTACWIKEVPFANDCHSYNVLLMFTTDGVIMKTIRNIDLGEPLLMWFADDILAMLDMSFLRLFNIQSYNRYVCHKCNKWFKFPNPLKVHIALKCDQLDINYFWTKLQNEFNLTMRLHNTQSVQVAVPANDYPQSKQTKIISELGKSEQSYPCSHCGKVFAKKYSLNIHSRIHTGCKPLKCPHCSQTFGDPSNFTKHKRIAHGSHDIA